MKELTVNLPDDLHSLIETAVADGAYKDPSHVVLEVLEDWQDRQSKSEQPLAGYSVERLRELWEEGIHSGDPQPVTPSFVQDIIAKGMARKASKKVA